MCLRLSPSGPRRPRLSILGGRCARRPREAGRSLRAAATPARPVRGRGTRARAPPPLPPSRTKWTRLVHPSVLIGHVSSYSRRGTRARAGLIAPQAAPREARAASPRAASRRRALPLLPRAPPLPSITARPARRPPPPTTLPYKVDTSRPSLRTNWTRLVPRSSLLRAARRHLRRDLPRLLLLAVGGQRLRVSD